MKKAVLFDIDGTLLDAWNFIFDAVKHTVSEHGQPYPSVKLIRKALGKPLLEFYTIALPAADPEMLAKTHHQFQQQNFSLIKLFPKAKSTLKRIKDKGFLLAAVSNRSRGSLIRSLKLTGIFKYFDVIVSAEDVVNPKPHQEHLLTALKHLKVKPMNAFIIGDTDKDILAGKNAGVKTIGVTYGFLGEEIKKYEPDFVIDDIEGILDIVK
ncbi:MAG: HAD-IA family hydrolase [Patescibacteria group bacterium]|nr:HAD-IA family hydrolase [Patescibacteria group bacterium]